MSLRKSSFSSGSRPEISASISAQMGSTAACSALAKSATTWKYLFCSTPALKSSSLILAAKMMGLLVRRLTVARSSASSSVHSTLRADWPASRAA